jgi:hypothetical protein
MQTLNSRLTSALLLFVLLLMPGASFAQSPREPFNPGETLTYDVMWTIFRAGSVSATIRTGNQGNHDTYEVTASARSEGFVSLGFDVNDVFKATSSAQTLCSEGIVKKVSEGHRHRDTRIAFDYAGKHALLDERDPNEPKSPAKHAESDIPPCVEDVVTAFYYLRRQKLEVGHTIELPVNDGSKTQRVIVEVQTREKVQTPLGTFDTIRVEPKVFSGLLKRKGRMLIWFSADDRQLPVRVKAMISVGSITGTLRSITYQKPNVPTAAH